MSFAKAAVTAAVALAAIGSFAGGSAFADTPRAKSINLGAMNGVAYYTEEAGSFRVVATLAQREGMPIRVETMLAPGQTVVLSTAKGQSGLESVELSRDEVDGLTVRPVAAN